MKDRGALVVTLPVIIEIAPTTGLRPSPGRSAAAEIPKPGIFSGEWYYLPERSDFRNKFNAQWKAIRTKGAKAISFAGRAARL